MDQWDATLKDLADDPGDYAREGGTVLLVRHGVEHSLTLAERPGAGLSVAVRDPAGTVRYIPLGPYIQRDILGLPRLATQITRVLERAWNQRPAAFIDGPATSVAGRQTVHWQHVAQELPRRLFETEPGTTHVIQLMAAAGRGKTALIEHLAVQFARDYKPDEYPVPLLLPVDLLGRYVGTVDDAIAGSLNNTYLFPGLSQRDITLALRLRWLILALDGFDELVARVGVRDAFNRITELLDQLSGSGTIMLSAREAFFDLYQITAAIRSYLQPRHGSYTTTVVTLLPWDQEQGVEVFRSLRSPSPGAELSALLEAFEGDREIVFHPFFLTRLADLWLKGERFADAGGRPDSLARSKYVIETFIQREVTEKWVDREHKPLLSLAGHVVMLGALAEEMWRSGAFRLGKEELELAAQLGLGELDIPVPLQSDILARLPTHAALLSRERWIFFSHDMFLHFFLGYRLAVLLKREERHPISEILSARELGPHVIDWLFWHWGQDGGDTARLISFLGGLADKAVEGTLGSNLAELCARALKGYEPRENISIHRLTFVGDALSDGTYKRVQFEDCSFWQIDLTGSRLESCSFRSCTFSEMRVDRDSRLEGTEFVDCRIASLQLDDDRSLFAPEDIGAFLKSLGARIVETRPVPPVREDRGTKIDDLVLRSIERYIKLSQRTCDVAVEDVAEDYGSVAAIVAKIGVGAGLFKEVDKATSGPKKTFVRFRVDRQKVLRGQLAGTGEPPIDRFWSEIRDRYTKR